MNSKCSFLFTTILRKQVVALTGAGLSLFVLAHMLGNMLIFLGPEVYNTYSHKLISNPAIYLIEAALVFIFLVHVALAVTLNLRNKSARTQGYASGTNGNKAVTLASKTMVYQGVLLFVFIVLHLLTFKFGNYYQVDYNGLVIRDLYRLVIEVFQSPVYVVGYVFCMIVLLLHLSHGVSSVFQTLGLGHPRYKSRVDKMACAYSLIVALGFISQPVYVFLFLR